MAGLLIAYNNDTTEGMRDVFETCADGAKAICARHSVDFESVCPPILTSDNVCGKILGFQMLFIAAHGSNEAVFNEKETDNEVVSIHTTNYDFNGKGFYSVSCDAARDLAPELNRLGLRIFVGYDDEFRVKGDITPFCDCALAGLEAFLAGNTVADSRKIMNDSYDSVIAEFNKSNPEIAWYLSHNKIHLCFEGEDSLRFSDLV